MPAPEATKSEKVEPIRPLEILCQILQFAVGPDGVKALLPLTHINVQWRRAALGDSSLWTTVYLKQTFPKLFDMILERSGNRLFTAYVDYHDLNRLAKLWKLTDRIEELHYSTEVDQLVPFLSSLGPAPNLKLLCLRPELRASIEEPTTLIRLPTIFSGCFPLLRVLTLTNMITWPTALFKGLVSFKCGVSEDYPISPVHVLDALRESPSIEYLRLEGYCTIPQGFHPSTVTLPSLEECALVGRGTASLIQFLTVPVSARMFLCKPYIDDGVIFPKFDHISAVPNLCVLDEVSTISSHVDDHVVRLRVENSHGGHVDAVMDELYNLSRHPLIFGPFIRSSFECAQTLPSFKTTRVFILDVDRGWMWEPEEARCFAHDVVGLIFNLPSIEEVKLRGVPSPELSAILGFLHSAPYIPQPCPNLRRLDIESTPMCSPRPLLLELNRLLVERNEAGEPLHFVTVKVKCEILIPAPEHLALLTSWRGFVGEGVRLEYEETEFRKLPRCCPRNHGNQDEWDYEWDDGGEDDDEDEDEDDDEKADTGDPDGDGLGWDGWPENWPVTVGEVGGH